MKKTIFILLLLGCGITAVAQPIYHSKQYYKVGKLYYHITSDSTVETAPMQSCDVFPRNITVPASVTIENHVYAVTRIGDETFLGLCPIESFSMPNTITEIGKEAFSGFPGTIRLPESVRRIEWAAFAYIHADVFHIPGNVEHIDEVAFCGAEINRFTVDSNNRHYVAVDSVALCSSDTTLLLVYASHTPETHYSVPPSVRRIASSALKNPYLRSVTLPEGLREIGGNVFSSKLPGLHIPASVCRIGGVLRDTASTRFILTIDPTNQHYKIEDNMLLSIDGDTLLLAMGASGIFRVPSGVKVIANGVFECNQALTKVVLPDGLTDIGEQSFALSPTEVILPSSLQRIGEEAFFRNSGTKRISIPNLSYMGKSAFEGSSVEVVDSVFQLRTIPKLAFADCALQSFHWGDVIETVEDYAFYGASFTPREKTMPLTLRRIGMKAFITRSRIKGMIFPGRVDTIGESALRCRVLHLRDTHPPVVYSNALSYTDSVYVPCGYIDAFEQRIEHDDNTSFSENCAPVGFERADPFLAFSFFPNPARNSVTVTIPSLEGYGEAGGYASQPSTLNPQLSITLTDAAGRELLNTKVTTLNFQLSLSQYPAGTYFLTLRTPDTSSTQRLVIK